MIRDKKTKEWRGKGYKNEPCFYTSLQNAKKAVGYWKCWYDLEIVELYIDLDNIVVIN